MVIDEIMDLEALKVLAKGMQTYQARLERRNKELAEENARLRGEVSPEQLLLLAAKREEELARLQQKVFGRSSERRTPPVKEEPKAKEPQRGHGPTAQPRLPIREVHHELDPGCRDCPSCGGEVGELTDMGVTEDSEEITIDSRKIVLEIHKRHKYRCACNAAVKTAPGPLKLIPGGRYSIEFGIAVVLGKREEHLPLERQRRVMAREGLEITTQSLCDIEGAVAELLRPSYELVYEYIRGADELGADETRWRMMGGGEGSKTWWMWCLTTDDATYYVIDPSRGGEVARRLLGGFQGTVSCDGYSVYASLAHPETGVKGLRLAHCYSHVRRKFFEIQTKYPVECEQALKQIDALFVVERGLLRPGDLEGDAKIAALEERARVRREVSKPMVDALFGWAKRQRSLPSSGLRTALRYMLDREEGLRAFLEEPMIALDNNRAERALRGPVVGRKNHYGSRSKRGTEVAAILYTLVETCRRCGVDPEHYLREALKRALSDPGGGLLPQALLHRPSS